jgi:Mg-chelatase subunit ChlD
MPTKGKTPEKETIRAAALAKSSGISISVVGIRLDSKGIRLAERLVEVGEGRLYLAPDAEDVDEIVLRDYSSLAKARFL